jgi:N-acetylmuramate 1-kinase
MPQYFDDSAIERLKLFLRKQNQTESFEQLTPDASTREYFRIVWNGKTAVACVYPEIFDEKLPYLDVTELFLAAGLPVAEVFAVDFETGVVVHEDFGDRLLRDALTKSSPKIQLELIDGAIGLIARIQKATPLAFQSASIASRLKFDEEKLLWELDFFKLHYFTSFSKRTPDETTDHELTVEFVELSRELEKYARVLTHRDFHAANLMIDRNGDLRIIDHQDARIGSVAYDLVSLLLDRITEPPSADRLRRQMRLFLEARESVGLERIEYSDFAREFDLMTVQRCLKAIGTFSNQAANFGKTHYIQFIDPMFRVVLETSERLQRFPNLQRIIKNI